MPSHLSTVSAGRIATVAAAATIFLAGSAALADGSSPSLASSAVSACRHPPYEAHVVSSSPLVVYLAGFVTADERAHLQNVTRYSFVHSAVAAPGAADGHRLHDVRTSRSTNLPPDPVVRCLQERALRFQGLLGSSSSKGSVGAYLAHLARLEPLQLVKYAPGEHYHFHTDWFTDPVHADAAHGGNRATSFFAYVRASSDGDGYSDSNSDSSNSNSLVRGGGTNFPLLNMPADSGGNDDDNNNDDDDEWCSYIDCDEPWDHGVTFRPIEGNAVFWENLLPATSGSAIRGARAGDPRSLHAGLPVIRGEKIGLNIWTREDTLPADVRG